MRFYVLLSITAFVLIAFEAFLTSLPFAEPILDFAQALQQRQLDFYFEMIGLLITLATAAMGGIAGFVLNRDKVAALSRRQLRRVLASWTLGAVSLYFGYLAYQQAVAMLANGVFNPSNPRVWVPTRAQFWSFLACVIVFADFVYTGLQKTGTTPGKRSS